jgi:hypothetical protein
MRKQAFLIAVTLLAVSIAALFARGQKQAPAPPAQSRPGPAWQRVRAEIEKSWAKSYPREKVLNIEKKGEPDFKHEYGGSETTTFGTASFSWYDWSTSWSETKVTREKPKGFFFRQVALVTAERPNGSRARFTVAALFKQRDSAWDFAELALNAEVEELGGGGDMPAPIPAEDARKLFLEAAQKQCLPEYKITSARLEGEPKLGRSAKRVWYAYKVVLEGSTPQGKKVRCQVTDLAWLHWETDKKAYTVNSSFGCSTRVCDVE